MTSNNHKNQTCASAEQIVSYLYGEISFDEKTAFESHLNKCPNCADELVGLNHARSFVSEWREAELSKTPELVIPFEKTIKDKTVAVKRNSPLAELRRLFTLSSAWATAGFAFLIVVAGLILFVFRFNNNQEIAVSDSKAENSAVAAADEKKAKRDAENYSEEKAKNSSNDDLTNQNEARIKSPKPINIGQAAPKNSIVKIENQARNVPKAEITAKNFNKLAPAAKEKLIDNAANTTLAKNSQIPKLASFDEVEDKSPRLADLLAEVENK